VWSGDIHSDCADFRLQITAGIHMGVAGIPWFTTDIGGFGGGDIEDPGFRELLVRWFQFGAFCPVMRMHGDRQPSERVLAADGSAPNNSGAPNELWGFGEDVYEILVRYVKLREAMRPYTGALEGWGCRSAPPLPVRLLGHCERSPAPTCEADVASGEVPPEGPGEVVSDESLAGWAVEQFGLGRSRFA
jgi:alpha-D-xyloside xylohydrolase